MFDSDGKILALPAELEVFNEINYVLDNVAKKWFEVDEWFAASSG